MSIFQHRHSTPQSYPFFSPVNHPPIPLCWHLGHGLTTLALRRRPRDPISAAMTTSLTFPIPFPFPYPCLTPSTPPPACFFFPAMRGHGGGRLRAQQSGGDPFLLGKPVVSVEDGDGPALGGGGKMRGGEEWLDWEDRILEDTVPLVGFVRMVLHSGKYRSGDRLSAEHEKLILERILPYHPEYEKKVGCGIDYITIGYHPEFERSRCLFIVRKDGEMVDISYWKCIKGLIHKNYPLYADSFILRHFRRRRRGDAP